MAHDWAGHRLAVTRGERTWHYHYDRNGNLETRLAPVPVNADPTLYTTSYQHDDLDRVIAVSFPDQQIISLTTSITTSVGAPISTTLQYHYDVGRNGIGRLGEVALPYATVRHSYEARGLPVREERTFTLQDVATVSASQWDDGQQWQISYDGRGLVDQVQWFDPQSQAWTAVADFDRSLLGLPRTRNSAFGQTRQYTYDNLARPAAEMVTINGNPVAARAYTYNGSGDLTHVTGNTAGVSAEARYNYDRQHRLTGASAPNGYVGSFSYSANGNLLSANVTWNGSSESRSVRYEYGDHDPQAVDRLIDQSSNAIYADFDYDLAGNMQQRNTPTGDMGLLWDGRDQLRLVDGTNSTEVYFYDASGTRMLAVSATEGVRFWFGESETHFDLTGAQNKRYLHLSAGGATIARVEDGSKLELQYADALQNLMFSLDKAGNVLASFFYGPFGEVVQATGKEDHRRQFNGKENDKVTGLRYYGYRYYDPLALRWNSSDPLYRVLPELGMSEPQRMNLYSFSLNNPVRYYDPDGREPKDDDASCPVDDKENCGDEADSDGTSCQETDQCSEDGILREPDPPPPACDNQIADCVEDEVQRLEQKEQELTEKIKDKKELVDKEQRNIEYIKKKIEAGRKPTFVETLIGGLQVAGGIVTAGTGIVSCPGTGLGCVAAGAGLATIHNGLRLGAENKPLPAGETFELNRQVSAADRKIETLNTEINQSYQERESVHDALNQLPQ